MSPTSKPHHPSSLQQHPPPSPAKLTPKTSPQRHKAPLAYDNKAADGKRHGRASSFSGFVSRILPSRREERGYTLRKEFKDDGSQDAVGLVFGMVGGSEKEDGSGKAKGAMGPAKDRPQGDGDISRWGERGGFGSDGYVYDKLHIIPPRPISPLHFHGPTPLAGMVQIQSPSPSPNRSYKHQPASFQQPLDVAAPQLPEIKIGSFNVPQLDLVNTKAGGDPRSGKALRALDDGDENDDEERKAARRAQKETRKSLRASGDFLGVQGANPRTGCWDLSEATTSTSNPSFMSGEAKRRADERVKEMRRLGNGDEGVREKVEEGEMERREKKERKERKRREVKLRQRGKWRVGQNGWNSVVEPNLSPVLSGEGGKSG